MNKKEGGDIRHMEKGRVHDMVTDQISAVREREEFGDAT